MTTDEQARLQRLQKASTAAYADRPRQGEMRIVGVHDEDLHHFLTHVARLERETREKDERIAELEALIDRQYQPSQPA